MSGDQGGYEALLSHVVEEEVEKDGTEGRGRDGGKEGLRKIETNSSGGKLTTPRDTPTTPTTPNTEKEWTNSASERLLPQEDSSSVVVEEAKVEAEPTKEGKQRKPFIAPETKVLISHFLRIFTYSTRGDKWMLGAASLASICTGVTLPLMNVVFGQLVGAFSAFYKPDSGETPELFLKTINQNVLYILYLFLFRLVLDYISILGFRIVSLRISASMRLTYLSALFSQPISVLDTLPSGQTAAILTITTNILQYGISEKLSLLLQSLSLVTTALAISFYYNWLLTLVTSSGLVFIVGFYILTIPKLVKGLKGVEEADMKGAEVAGEAFGGVRMVAAMGAEGKMGEKFARWVEESRRRGLAMSSLVAIQQAPVFFAIHATFALSFWFAIKLYLNQEITSVTTMIIVLMSIMSIVLSLSSIASPLSAASRAATSASILFTIIDAPCPKTTGLLPPHISAQQDIVLENVNFAYPLRADVKVLEGMNVRFEKGRITAIVGASGSGKSTVVGLIERWYEMDGNLTDNMLTLYFRNGSIRCGDTPLHKIDLKWWRSQIGLVQQTPFLFNDTIYRNVEYGLIGTRWENAHKKKRIQLVRKACKEAFAEEFILRLPLGYLTPVGDSGIQLSGGQRQRLAIARAIIKSPQILILDEATSAIDVRGERIVQAALNKVSKGRTTIMIAHRLSTVMKAHKIVVLKGERVVQEGTHEELIGMEGGVYCGLAGAQRLGVGVGDEGGVGREGTEGMVEEGEEAEDEEGEVKSPGFEKVSLELDEGVVDEEEEELALKPLAGSFWLFLWEQRPQWRWYSLMLLATLAAGASFPLYAFLFAKLISLFNFWGDYLQEQTNFWCLMFTFLALGVGLSYFILGWSSNTISFNITATYRLEYFHNLLHKPIPYHDSPHHSIGTLTSLISTDPTHLQQLLGLNMAIVLISLFNILLSLALSFYFGFKLTFLTLFTILPIIFLAGFLRIRYETQFEKLNQEVFEESSKFATESIGGFRTVSAGVMEEEILGRYEGLLEELVERSWRGGWWRVGVFAVSDSVALLCMGFVLWYGGQLLASHEYTPFSYLVVYLAVVQGSTTAGQSLSFGPNIAQAFAAATRIRNIRPKDKSLLFESTRPEVTELDSSGKGPKIELKDVWFKYPTRDTPVLQGLSMTVQPGQFAAIVGPSGSGKTSLISLLERFYSPHSGQILYNTHPISHLPLQSYRSNLSLVSQEPSLFSGSIKENILLGVEENSVPDERLKEVCKKAEIHEFIEGLPEGYETWIGPKGTSLSGGQLQRLSIARALIRSPKLLLLDEATSALDSETEKAIQDTLFQTHAQAQSEGGKGTGRTTIAIAHRLATIQNADVIFVVVDGRVVEKGSHGELVGIRGGVYADMCRAQALDV